MQPEAPVVSSAGAAVIKRRAHLAMYEPSDGCYDATDRIGQRRFWIEGGVQGVTPLSAFTIDTSAKLTGLSRSQLARWDRNDFFTPTFADPNRRRPYSRVYSFEDLVGLRTISRLLKLGAKRSELRKIRAYFQEIGESENAEWARRKFYLVGGHVFFSEQEAIVAAAPLGQIVDPTMLPLEEVVGELRKRVERLTERGPRQFGKITRNRYVMNGRPVLEGTRIPTATIVELIHEGYDYAAILSEFPRLTVKDIESAVHFEENAQNRAVG
jgi:uncharacterized protein (DUF433 family)